MDYTEIKIKVSTQDLDAASAVAEMASPYGFYVEDYSDMLEVAPTMRIVDYYDDELLHKDTEHAVIHIYLSADRSPAEAAEYIAARLTASQIDFEAQTDKVREEDWANSWKAFYKPFSVGSLTVCPSWEKCELAEGQTLITIDPGMAFGTGTHETTRLCLKSLAEQIKSGDRVLDVGCGSGILALAASKLGAGYVAAVDIDAVAVDVARRNAEQNNCDIDVFLGSLLDNSGLAEKIGAGYDLITANIVADVIIAFSGYFYSALKDGGTLVASGLIDTRVGEAVNALQGAGFTLVQSDSEKCWYALTLKK